MIKHIIKKLIYRLRGRNTVEDCIKEGLKVGKNFNPQYPFNLDISHCWLITIGDNVTFGPNVQLLAHDASPCMPLGYAKIGQINIGDNVFIGANSVVLPNVSIGSNSIVGAGSVVTHDVPNNMVYGGNPAKFIMRMDEFIDKHKNRMDRCPIFNEDYTLRGNISAVKKKEQKMKIDKIGGYVK